MVRWQIQADQLRRFLALLSGVSEYRFDEGDWDAVRFGLETTANDKEGGYEYDLLGKRPISLRLARCAAAQVLVQATAEASVEAKLAAIVATTDAEILARIQLAFQGAPRPEHFTDY